MPKVRMLQGMGNGQTGIAYNIGDIVEVSQNAFDAWTKHGVAEKAPEGAKLTTEPQGQPPPQPTEPRTTTRKPPRTGQVGPKPA